MFKFSVESGIGSDGNEWQRTEYQGWGKGFHPEDEFRTTGEILQDCRELEADCLRLQREIASDRRSQA